MNPGEDVGQDHCRVTVPKPSEGVQAFLEYYRHLLPYDYAARQISPKARLVEVGCGAGYGADYVAKFVPDVVATDMSAQAIAYARAHFPGVRFLEAQGDELPFDSNGCDAVLSFQVFEHVTDVPRFLGEIVRVLKPGGRAFLTTPNRRLRLRPGQKPWNPYHVREVTDDEFRAALASAFPEVKVLGVCASTGLTRIERERVGWNKVPWPLSALLRPMAVAWGRIGAGAPAEATLDDFRVGDDTRGCLDLLGIGTKSSGGSPQGTP